MRRQYIDTPQYTTINDVESKSFSLSASQYKSFCIKNKNTVYVKDFLSRHLKREDLGNEVGSDAYVESSPFSFIKTKALQPETYLLDIDEESMPHIVPQAYVKTSLQKGDLLISKDSNVGEIAILDKEYPNSMLCSGIYKLPIEKNKYYLLAFIKSDVVRQQIDFLVPRGSTIRHGKTKFLDCLVPIPNINKETTIEYIEILVQAIINKEMEIRKKHQKILDCIQSELNVNQKPSCYHYTFPSINEILDTTRLDSSLYSEEFKKNCFLTNNYLYGSTTISNMGFYINRGQNLQVSCIGQSVYSDTYRSGFYTLIKPTNITKFGTVPQCEYLGNSNDLLCLKKGDIIFGAEGTFRSTVVIEESKNTITNIHGIIFNQDSHDIKKGIFLKLILDYYHDNGMIKSFSVGGNGGSLAIKYLDYLKIPNFPNYVEEKIVRLYHNSDIIYDVSCCGLNDFLEYDNQFNNDAGIYELDKSMTYLKAKLEKAINDIVDDIEVKTAFKDK